MTSKHFHLTFLMHLLQELPMAPYLFACIRRRCNLHNFKKRVFWIVQGELLWNVGLDVYSIKDDVGV